MFKWIIKIALPTIAANIDLDIDTVLKKDGKYLRIRVEVWGFTLIDEFIKVVDEQPSEKPIDVFKSQKVPALPEDLKSKWNAELAKQLKNAN